MSKRYLLKKTKRVLQLAFLFIFLFAFIPVYAQVQNPQSGSIGLEGAVPGPPPQNAATINTPVNGQTFTSIPIVVSGTCDPGLIVEIYKNDIFAGSAICTSNGTYQVEIDLFIGENTLIARVRDLLGQAGPDSNTVTVFYEPQVDQSDRQLPAQQLLLTSTATFRGANPGSEIRFPITISGGVGPYAISITWGDGSSDVISRSDTGTFDIAHVYSQPGIYRIVIKATDQSESVAFLQLVAVVNGEASGVDEVSGPTRVITRYIIWPILVMLPLVPLAFWFGMRYQKKRSGM